MRELAKNTYLPFKSHLTKYEVMENNFLFLKTKFKCDKICFFPFEDCKDGLFQTEMESEERLQGN